MKEQILHLLNKYIYQTKVSEEGIVYFLKEQLGQDCELKFEMYTNEHNPPHFHVKSKNGEINASFLLSDCSLLHGEINPSQYKRIKFFYVENKSLLEEYWNNKVIKHRK